MKYRARTNGNIVELSADAAALLVPSIYEEIPTIKEAERKPRADEQPTSRKPR